MERRHFLVVFSNRDHFRPSMKKKKKKPLTAATLALGLPTRPLASPGPGLARRRRRSQIRTYCSSLRRLWHRWVFGAKIRRWRRAPQENLGWR